MFPLKSDLLVQLGDLTDAATGTKVTGATVTMSLYEEAPLVFNTGVATKEIQRVTPSSTVVNSIAFTDGGNSTPADYEIEVGNVIVGETGGATATVKSVTVTSGTWATNDAVGILELTSQVGDFQAEALQVGTTTGTADVAGNSDQGGAFTFSFDGATTAAIDGNATLAAIKSALEALSNITTVNVTGTPLDTDPVNNGFYVEWASANPEEDGNVPMLTIGIASLLGPASVSISETVRGHLVGALRDAGGGDVGLPVEGHGRIAGDYIYVIGTSTLDGEHAAIVSVSRDEIVITAAYVAQEFTSREEVFVGIKGASLPGISLSDDGDGDYSAYLPDNLRKYTRRKRCMLLVTIAKGGLDLVIVSTSPTGFYKGT